MASSSSASPPPTKTPATNAAGQLVREPRPHDVLFGRGKNTNCFSGNIYFRQLVAERATEYVTLERGAQKGALAEAIVRTIQHDKGGRFLRSVTAGNARGERLAAWEVVDDDIVLAKVKQAMWDAALLQQRNADGEEPEDAAVAYAATAGIRPRLQPPHESNMVESGRAAASVGASSSDFYHHKHQQLALQSQAAMIQQQTLAAMQHRYPSSDQRSLLYPGWQQQPPPTTRSTLIKPPAFVPAEHLRRRQQAQGGSRQNEPAATAFAQQQIVRFPPNRIDRLLAEVGVSTSTGLPQPLPVPSKRRSRSSSSSSSDHNDANDGPSKRRKQDDHDASSRSSGSSEDEAAA